MRAGRGEKENVGVIVPLVLFLITIDAVFGKKRWSFLVKNYAREFPKNRIEIKPAGQKSYLFQLRGTITRAMVSGCSSISTFLIAGMF